jgi:hypothetical protein
VTGWDSDNAFKIVTPEACSTTGTPCTIRKIIDRTGDGRGNRLTAPNRIAADSTGSVYVSGRQSYNALKIQPYWQVPVLSNRGLAVLGASLVCIVSWVGRRQRRANA